MNHFSTIPRFFLVLCSLFVSVGLLGQVRNGYARVTGISGTVLDIDETNAAQQNETADAFVIGERAIIMQMKDSVLAVLRRNDNTNFGLIDLTIPGYTNRAGKFEIVTITNVTRDPGNANRISEIEVANAPSTFNINARSMVQLITFRNLGTNPTLTGATALAWDKTNGIGGVIALEAGGTLTLTGSISAAGAGYKGGPRDGNTNTGNCEPSAFYRIDTTTGNFAQKGEGIHLSLRADHLAGRARIANGGGGGNTHNAGGGGGGNYSEGGTGGIGWNNALPTDGCLPSAGGFGGVDLSSLVTTSRVFMGGGGGAGEQNNNRSTRGGHGGGIIFLLANRLETSCAVPISINANGESLGLNTGNDAGSGGGGGGSIIMQISEYDISGTCPLSVTANGGNGGSVNDNAPHGAGGGGGAGLVMLSVANPSGPAEPDISFSAGPGTGGANDLDGIASGVTPLSPARADNGVGDNTTGLQFSQNTVLPVSLLSFEAIPTEKSVTLVWTALEQADVTYTLERYEDGQWGFIGSQDGLGGNSLPVAYEFPDNKPIPGRNIYRLVQQDVAGRQTVAGITEAFFRPSGLQAPLTVIPNPNKGSFQLLLKADETIEGIKIFDATGREVGFSAQTDFATAEIQMQTFTPGVYILQVLARSGSYTSTFVIVP